MISPTLFGNTRSPVLSSVCNTEQATVGSARIEKPVLVSVSRAVRRSRSISDHRSPRTSPRRQPRDHRRAHVVERRIFQGGANGAVFLIGQPTLAPTVGEPHDTTNRIIGVELLADGVGEDRTQNQRCGWRHHGRHVQPTHHEAWFWSWPQWCLPQWRASSLPTSPRPTTTPHAAGDSVVLVAERTADHRRA